ncbi:MAG: phospholipase D family protein, partial [Cyanobacteria bacterium]|nr:phospholipase D family protein [Cyanobacteriota bacterium]
VDPGLYFSFPNTRKGVQKLANAGVPIQFYKANRMIEEKLHAKWAVFDEKKLMIGSANWSAVGLQSNADQDEETEGSVKTASLKGNHEANVLVESAKVCKAFVDQFKFDWKSRSFPILVKSEDGSGAWKKLVPSSVLGINSTSAPKDFSTLAAFA